MHPVEVNTLRPNVVANENKHHGNNNIWSEPQWAYNIIWFWICTEHSTKFMMWLLGTAIQTATVAMHADGNGTGSSLRSWVLNYVTTSVNVLWVF